MQFWRAVRDDFPRTPGLAELARYSERSTSAMDPSDFVRRLLDQLPSLGQGVSDLEKEIMKDHSPVLRSHVEESSPMLASLAEQLPPGQSLPHGIDPAAPMFSFTQEMVDLSAEPVEDSIFLVPAGYSKVALEEILKTQLDGADVPR
jgi:hypothetical protein